MHPFNVRKTAFLVAAVCGLGLSTAIRANDPFHVGDLVVSSSTYDGTASTVTIGQTLPGGGTAVANGSFYQVFDNTQNDGSFSVASPFTLLQFSLAGTPSAISITSDGALAVPTSVAVNSFSSKSEGALNLSADGTSLTLLGYAAPDHTLDISNTNTPGAIDSTNPDTAAATYRTVIKADSQGNITAQNINGFSGDNGRAVVDIGGGKFIGVGNANNGTGTAANIVATAGVQVGSFGSTSTTQVGPFSVFQTNPATGLPYYTTTTAPKDKVSKDDNFRGETVFNNTLYVTKGSGSNGIDTVYQVGATGGLQNVAITPGTTAINVLPGFPTQLARNQPAATGYYPFGIWFANATTLYVADEGDGTYTDAVNGSQTHAGLQKWTFDQGAGTWSLDYVLQAGLIGNTYTSGTFPYALTAGGLRNITGQVNTDGTVTIYGVTASLANLPTTGIDASFDQGATPDQLVAISDGLSNLTAGDASGESFQVLSTASLGQVYRGVAFAPVPEPASLAVLSVASIFLLARRAKRVNG